MKPVRLNSAATAAVLLALGSAPAAAQYQAQPQYGVVQAQPFATQSSVVNLDTRIVALERQIADLLRAQEENGHRINELETRLKQSQEEATARIAALEAQLAARTQVTGPVEQEPAESSSRPKPAVADAESKPKPSNAVANSDTDPAEEAYDAGYQLWKAGKFDEAVGALRAFASAYPRHRRTSWANNLAGRALLDKGEPRAAAEVLLANYRSNPKGERAADSLYYLGQALMKLKQPGQACKAYAELEAVYGSAMRADLKKMLPEAKSDAKCS
jgi:TolA-binding protein